MFTDKFPEIKRDMTVPLHYRANRALANIQQTMNLLNAASARRLYDLERHYLTAIQYMVRDCLDWLENTKELPIIEKSKVDLDDDLFQGEWDPNIGIKHLHLGDGEFVRLSNSDGIHLHRGDFIINLDGEYSIVR